MLHTVGELCLSPVGLSFVTKLAPKKMAALFMGVWFFAVFMGNVIAGQLGSLYGSMSAQPHGAVKFFAICLSRPRSARRS